MDLGDAKYTVSLTDKATDKMNSIGKSMGNMKANMIQVGVAMAAAAAAVTVALGKMVKDWAAAGDEIAKTAKRTGWSTEAISEMAYAAKISGASLSDIEKATKKMSKALVDASDGLETYQRAFDKLGLSTEDLLKMDPEEQFWAVAAALANVENETVQTALAVDLFGRSGTMLLPLLESGAEGMAEMREQAHELGVVFDAEAAEAAEGMTDAMTRLDGAMNGVKFAIAEQLAPTITDLLDNQITPGIENLRLFIEENDDLKEAFIGLANAAVTFAMGLAQVFLWLKKLWDILPDWDPLKMLLSGEAGATIGRIAHGMEGYEGPPGVVPRSEWENIGQGVPAAAGGGGVTVNVGNLMGNEAAIRALVNEMAPYLGEATRRTSFPTVNSLGYMPGSSAP